MLCYVILYYYICIILYYICIIGYYIISYHSILYYVILYYIILNYIILYYVMLCYIILYYILYISIGPFVKVRYLGTSMVRISAEHPGCIVLDQGLLHH